MSQLILFLFAAARRGKTQNKTQCYFGITDILSPPSDLAFFFFNSFIQSYIGKSNLAKVQGKVNAKNDPSVTCLETLESQVMNMCAVLNPYLNFSVA